MGHTYEIMSDEDDGDDDVDDYSAGGGGGGAIPGASRAVLAIMGSSGGGGRGGGGRGRNDKGWRGCRGGGRGGGGGVSSDDVMVKGFALSKDTLAPAAWYPPPTIPKTYDSYHRFPAGPCTRLCSHLTFSFDFSFTSASLSCDVGYLKLNTCSDISAVRHTT